MAYRVFYFSELTGEEVPASKPQPMELAEAAELLEKVLKVESSFFGLVDTDGTTLQFYFGEDGYWMEIPTPTEKGSYGRHLSLEQAADTVRKLPETISRKSLGNLKFQKW